MRVYVCGQRAFGESVYALVRALGHAVAGVSSPALDSRGEIEDRLRRAALRDGAPWMEAGRLSAATLPEGVDLIVAAHSHDFIGAKTRRRSALGAIGYHPSLLPRHRGRDAIRWTLHMRDAVAGGSVYWLSEAMDGGDIAAQEHVFVAPDETPESLWRGKLAPLGLRLFERALRDIAGGRIVRRPQAAESATWEPSWERPPAFRPDLEMIGAMPPGFRVDRGEGC